MVQTIVENICGIGNLPLHQQHLTEALNVVVDLQIPSPILWISIPVFYSCPAHVYSLVTNSTVCGRLRYSSCQLAVGALCSHGMMPRLSACVRLQDQLICIIWLLVAVLVELSYWEWKFQFLHSSPCDLHRWEAIHMGPNPSKARRYNDAFLRRVWDYFTWFDCLSAEFRRLPSAS